MLIVILRSRIFGSSPMHDSTSNSLFIKENGEMSYFI